MPQSCVMCGERILPNQWGWDQGHNAEPLETGRCCDTCNHHVVLYRLGLMQDQINKSNKNDN